jgi:surfactin synthase thioesterase subunit
VAQATTMEEAAERLLPALSGLGRFAILGHSLGGLLAYELATLALASGSALPDFLVLAATRPPHEVSASRHNEIYRLPDEEMLDELALTGHVPAHVRHSPMRSMFVPGLRADLAILSRYQPVGPFRPLPIVVLSWFSRSDPIAPNDAMAAWRSYTTRDFLGTEFSGGHFFIHEQPSAVAKVLVDYLSTC